MLSITGLVELPRRFSAEDLRGIDSSFQAPDVSQLDPARRGRGVRLAGLLSLVRPQSTADYLTVHAGRDDFHASVPLALVRDRAVVIYELDGGPLPEGAGGPFRLFIPNPAACRSAEIDECASVKFVDRIELTAGPGQDNRPADERAHAALHARQG